MEDLADAHIAVMDRLRPAAKLVYNLGIGNGYSVQQVLDAARRVTGQPIPAAVGPRRPGDPPQLFADASKIAREIGWKAQYTDIEAIIETAWRWFRSHPTGYQTP